MWEDRSCAVDGLDGILQARGVGSQILQRGRLNGYVNCHNERRRGMLDLLTLQLQALLRGQGVRRNLDLDIGQGDGLAGQTEAGCQFIGANSIPLGRCERGDAACQGPHQAGVAPALSPTHRHHLDAGGTRRVEQRLPGRDIHPAADRLQVDVIGRLACAIRHSDPCSGRCRAWSRSRSSDRCDRHRGPGRRPARGISAAA